MFTLKYKEEFFEIIEKSLSTRLAKLFLNPTTIYIVSIFFAISTRSYIYSYILLALYSVPFLQDSFNVKIAEEITVNDLNKAFNEGDLSGKLDFSKAKTLVLFCNGSWCGQTPKSVLSLLELSYPANKIKYYRDGIQGWLNLGLTTVVTSTDKSKAACKLVPS